MAFIFCNGEIILLLNQKQQKGLSVFWIAPSFNDNRTPINLSFGSMGYVSPYRRLQRH